jgi:hypothetical protein
LPIVEYRDAMPERDFKAAFSWKADTSKLKGKAKSIPQMEWTWHDKTRFPWERVIKEGAKDGMRYASASDLRTAAERVADSLKLRAEKVANKEHMLPTKRMKKIGGMLRSLANALEGLNTGK